MSEPIIRSLLDTDLYKLTMWQALFHAWPANSAEYRFVCRNPPAFPLAELVPEVEAELDRLCRLRFTEEELAYLGTMRFLSSDFIDFLRIFQLQGRYLTVRADGDALGIVAQGPQVHVMGFEIFVLAIVSELYSRRFDSAALRAEAQRRLQGKIALLEQERPARATPFEFSDFGTRRRYSRDWHDRVVATLKAGASTWFRGTSNVHLAMTQGLTAIGTMAHEYLQTFQAVGVQLRHFQKAALEAWVHEYRGDLGIALTDVVGMDAFLADFDLYFAKLFDGLRHDSGDPFEWGEKALAHYERLRIRPATKRLVFSDGLDLPGALAIHARFADRIPCGFGIGTNLTNDTGVEPLNVVMKLVAVNGQPVAKLSDSPGKTLCDDETFLAYLRHVFGRVV